jgi:hypothetical protein
MKKDAVKLVVFNGLVLVIEKTRLTIIFLARAVLFGR